MKTMAAALAATLIATPVLAQATPPASQSAPAATPSENQSAGTSSRDTGRTGRGAYIKMQGPNGSEITVRCADGDTTRACADVVMQLVDRARNMSSERRRDWDRDRSGGEMRGGERDRDRDY